MAGSKPAVSGESRDPGPKESEWHRLIQDISLWLTLGDGKEPPGWGWGWTVSLRARAGRTSPRPCPLAQASAGDGGLPAPGQTESRPHRATAYSGPCRDGM